MKAIDSGKDKVKKICDVLKRETLEPAKRDALELIRDAEEKAEVLLAKAKEAADEEIRKAREQIAQEKRVFESSLSLSAKQALNALKAEIATKLMSQEVGELINVQTPEMSAKLLDVILQAIEKDGLDANLEIALARNIDKDELVKHLGASSAKFLEKNELVVGNFVGGVSVRLKDAKITIDLTEQTLKELLINYTREDFRSLILES
ncbi:MAG: V-type proton ATPase subunit E [Chlamydiia bacterium]|nr:V-type proton ATPase subunit E [Chlamydiia bacterium]MCH9615375.1 V-type proton ATPase subunit E [Chlamydiia bacterium]MCH9628303.1 V-type proton ATPase subunit E [Chlamydiia bacterium]